MAEWMELHGLWIMAEQNDEQMDTYIKISFY